MAIEFDPVASSPKRPRQKRPDRHVDDVGDVRYDTPQEYAEPPYD